MLGIDVHEVSGGVGVDHDRPGIALAIHFHARDGIPARELHPCGVSKPALGINDVEEFSGVVDRNQYQQEEQLGPPLLSALCGPAPTQFRPRPCTRRQEYGVGTAQPVEQRDDGEAGQRAAAEIGGVERRNVLGLAGKDDGEFQSGDKERHGGSQINRGEPEKIRLRDFQRNRDAQHDHQHDRNDQRIQRAQARHQCASFEARQPVFSQVRKYASGAEAEQRDRNCEKCKVIEQHHREQPGERQFKQESGKAAEGGASQHGAIRSVCCGMVGIRRDVVTHPKGSPGSDSLTEGRDQWSVSCQCQWPVTDPDY